MFWSILLMSIPLTSIENQKEPNWEESQMTTPAFLYLILSKNDWKKSLEQKALSLSNDHQLFIHLATEAQVPQIAKKFFNDKDYVVLKVDTIKMQGRLIYETNPGGTNQYFHLYDGVIPLEAVKAINFPEKEGV